MEKSKSCQFDKLNKVGIFFFFFFFFLCEPITITHSKNAGLF